MDEEKQSSTPIVRARGVSMPTALERIRDVAPEKASSRVNTPTLKLSPLSRSEVISRQSILASYWLNLPFKEGAITVPKLYNMIRLIVEKYQAENEDAFYEQYADLLILKKDERPEGRWALRINHKKYDRRLAHHLFHYVNATTAYLGALANLFILANVEGQGRFATFGLSCKVGYIHTAANRMREFPLPEGLAAYISKYSKFAVGQTDYDALFTAIPMWITDVFGNRGQHCFSVSDAAASFLENGDGIADFDNKGLDAAQATELYNNMYKVLSMYGYDAVDATGKHHSYVGKLLDPTGLCCAVPSCPHVENGAVAAAEIGPSGHTLVVPLNDDGTKDYFGFTYVKNNSGEPGALKTDNIISRAWDTFNFWQTYLITYFSAFGSPNSQIRNFAVNDLHLLGNPMSVESFGKSINVEGYFDASSIADYMVFKKDNAVNTATIVKWAPILGSTSDDDRSTYFEDNYNRYPCDLDDTGKYLIESEKWPRLTPTVFHEVIEDTADGILAPYVANSIETPTVLFDADEANFPAKSPVGKYATLLDVASSASLDPETSSVDILALDNEVARKFVEDDNAIVFSERPTTPLTYSQPLIDCTDPLQCGFNVIISNEADAKDELTGWFTSDSKFLNLGSIEELDDVYQPPVGFGEGVESDPFYPTQPSFTNLEFQAQQYLVRSNVRAEGYMAAIKHAIIFMGADIFRHPVLKGSALTAGYPNAKITMNNSEAAEGAVAVMKVFKDSLSTVNESDITLDSLRQSVAASVGKAMTISRHSKVVKSGFPLALRMFDLLQSVGTEASTLRLFTYNPEYGPVNPFTYQLPEVGLMPAALMNAVDPGFRPFLKGNNNSGPITPYAGPNSIGSSRLYEYSPEMLNLAPQWTPLDTPATFWLWFIDNVSFSKIYRMGYSYAIHNKPVKLAGFSSPAKMLLAMYSRSVVYFTGSKDTVPFDTLDLKSLSVQEPNFSLSGSIKYAPMVNAPRNTQTRVASRGGYKRDPVKEVKTTGSYIVQLNEGISARGSESKVGKGDSANGSAAKKSSGSKSYKKRKNKRDGIFDNSSQGTDVDQANALHGNDGVDLDKVKDA